MAIFVLMAILLLVAAAEAEASHSRRDVIEDREVDVSESRVLRHGIAAEDHHTSRGRSAVQDGWGPPMQMTGHHGQSAHHRVKRIECGGRHGRITISVQVKVGSKWFSGTDSEVRILIYGDSQNSGWNLLDYEFYDDFQTNSDTVYTFCVDYLGSEITKIGVYTRRRGLGPDLYLDRVKVLYSSKCYFFSYDAWIKDEETHFMENPTSCKW